MHSSNNTNSNGNTSVSNINQQRTPSFNYYNHQNPKFNPQSTMDQNSRFNSHEILEMNCSTSKRSSKKDRHSKIDTARGPRDRRMRLSLDVAKKFFNLQDMLGFDKASQAIEWLLMKSKAAIISDLQPQQLSLMSVSNSPSSGSEKTISCNKEKKKVQRVTRSVYIDPSLAKETREKARARARKRTSEKKIIKLDNYDGPQYSKLRPSVDHVMDQNTNRLGSWIPFGENQVQLLTDQVEYPSSHFHFKQGIVGDHSSMLSSSWSPSFLYSYQHNPGLSHEHQFSEFQILGKPWEGINN